MKPTKPGIYEWFETDGTKRLVEVFDVASKLREVNGTEPPYFRVYWWGGYYNVNDETDPQHPEYDDFTKAEWPDRWGDFVGENGSLPEDQIYWKPTEEQRREIFRMVSLEEQFRQKLDNT